jgi:predicted DNA-binding transcriptional regulator AlpA
MSELIDAKELARRWSVPVSFVYDRTRKNGPEHIPHHKLGKYVRFDPKHVEAWMADKERGDE